ncbi:UNVERIFIED_CONTAM: hypothetical protein B566_EDAN017196 [Ephemera danica]|nr:hypothetical protein B566_EDAN017196 [Ephemera danica]
MALRAELKRKLLDDDEPFAKRVCLAYNVFISQRLQVERKEEVVLESFCELMSSKHSSVISPHEGLLSCLSSARMKQMLSSDIQPAVRSLIIETLKTSLASTNASEDEKCSAAKCTILVLQDGCMERYLNRKIKKFIQLCEAFLKYLSKTSLSDETLWLARQLLSALMSYHKRCPEDQDFRSKFLNHLLTPLVILQYHWEKSENKSIDQSNFYNDIIKCIQVVAMAKEHQEIYKSILDYILEHSSYTKYVTDAFFIRINTCEVDYSPEYLAPLVRVTFGAFVSRYRKSPDLVISMFAVLSGLIGIRPPNNENSKTVINLQRMQEILGANLMKQASIKKFELHTLRAMLEVLATGDFNLDDEYKHQGESGREWLARLITYILASFNIQHATAMLQALVPLAAVDLLLFESTLRDVVSWVCSISFNEIIEHAFSKLLIEALKASEKQQRTHKIILNILEGLGVALDKQGRDFKFQKLIDNKFLDVFEASCTVMHSKYYANLINMLQFHLEKRCVVPLEEHKSSATCVAYLVCKLLTRVLCAAKAAQHTTPAYLVEKFCDQMTTLGVLLGRFATAQINGPRMNFSVTEDMLELCWAWGEVRLLLLHYSDPDECKVLALESKHTDQGPFDVSLLHSYLSPELWIKFSEISKMPISCKKNLVALVSQKLRAFVLLHHGSSKTKTAMAEVSTSVILAGPLQPSLALVVPLLSKKLKKKKFARDIAGNMVAQGPWRETVALLDECDPDFVSYIVLALTRRIKDGGFGISSDVLEPLDLKKCSIECLKEVATKFSEAALPTKFIEMPEELLSILESLSLLVEKVENKTIRTACAMAILAACYDLQNGMELPAKLIMQLLGPMGKTAPLPTNAGYGQLICFLLSSEGEGLVMSLIGNCGTVPNSIASGVTALTKALKKEPTPIVACITNFLLPHISKLLKEMCKYKTDKLAVAETELVANVRKCSIKYETGVLLPAFCAALLVIQNEERILPFEIIRFLPSLIDAASTPKLLNDLLLCITQLNNKDILKGLWPQLCSIPHMAADAQTHLMKLVEGASSQQIDDIIAALVKQKLKSGFVVWHTLIELKGHTNWLRELQNCVRRNMDLWDTSKDCLTQSVVPTLKLLNAIAKSNLTMEYTLLDVCLDTGSALYYQHPTVDEGLIELLRADINLLNTLVTSRATLILERIPVLQQRFADITTTIAENAHPKVDMEDARQLVECAAALQRIGVAVYKYKRDFGRAAPYMVSDVLQVFSNYNVHVEVKLPLSGYLQALLQLCDEHAERFLLRSLPVASQQILRSHLEILKKEKQMRV